MLEVNQILTAGAAEPGAQVTLTYDDRKRSRLRTRTDGGDELIIHVPRGAVLEDGDLLGASTGQVVQVRAASETVSAVYAADAVALARACYHLGNRHVPVQIEAGVARYQHDHVLDQMIRGLGLAVVVEQVPFQPERGAYGAGHGPLHGHDHAHGHGHDGHGGHHHSR